MIWQYHDTESMYRQWSGILFFLGLNQWSGISVGVSCIKSLATSHNYKSFGCSCIRCNVQGFVSSLPKKKSTEQSQKILA